MIRFQVSRKDIHSLFSQFQWSCSVNIKRKYKVNILLNLKACASFWSTRFQAKPMYTYHNIVYRYGTTPAAAICCLSYKLCVLLCVLYGYHRCAHILYDHLLPIRCNNWQNTSIVAKISFTDHISINKNLMLNARKECENSGHTEKLCVVRSILTITCSWCLCCVESQSRWS